MNMNTSLFTIQPFQKAACIRGGQISWICLFNSFEWLFCYLYITTWFFVTHAHKYVIIKCAFKQFIFDLV